MAMVVKNNMSAISTLNTLNRNSASLTKSLAKVSSGMRINGAADDASGYAISERMRVQIRSLDQDNRNTQNGSSMMKVAEGAVSSTVEILKTLKEKVINAANDTNTDSDRATIQKELDQSIDQIDDNANMTYNGKYLVDGSKNKVGDATYTSLTNQSLSTDTTASTKLTDLKSRSGDDLQLQETDKITVSYVQQGKTYSTTFQVGDKTLQDIFTEAENIDTTSKTFASSDNKSVAAALDVTQANSSDSAAVKAAIRDLKEKLGHNELADASKSTLKFTDSHINFALEKDTAVTGMSAGVGTAAKGDTYLALKQAGIDAQTAYNSMSKSADTLATALASEGIMSAWDKDASTLKSDSIQKLIANGSAETKQAYDQYMTNLDTYEKAMKNANDKLDDFNNQMKQLAALELEDAYMDKRADYESKVDTGLKNLEKAASDNSNAVSYVDSKGATQTSAASDKNRSAFIKEMVADLKSQYMKADVATKTNAAKGITDTIKIGDKVVNTAAVDNVVGSNTLKTAMLAVDEAGGLVKDAYEGLVPAGADGAANVWKDQLEAAHNGVLQKYMGPQLLAGADIGLSASGDKVSTASGQNAVTVTAANSGVEGQIAGFTIRVTDENDNTKKSAQASLDDFNETIRAQNKSEDNAISLQTGTKANQTIRVGLTDMRSQALGLKGSDGSTLNIGTRENANAAINVLDNALQKALDQQTTIGAVQSRLEYTSSNLTTASENVTASESTIRDADMAKEMTEYTKNNVLLQAAQSMLSQANQNSSAVLSLLQ